MSRNLIVTLRSDLRLRLGEDESIGLVRQVGSSGKKRKLVGLLISPAREAWDELEEIVIGVAGPPTDGQDRPSPAERPTVSSGEEAEGRVPFHDTDTPMVFELVVTSGSDREEYEGPLATGLARRDLQTRVNSTSKLIRLSIYGDSENPDNGPFDTPPTLRADSEEDQDARGAGVDPEDPPLTWE